MTQLVRRATFVLTLASVLAAPRLTAQVPAPVSDMLRRLFASRDFAPERFGPARWIDGGAAYTTVEPSPDLRGGSDIVRSEEHTSELQSRLHLVCRLLLEKK